MPWNLTTALNKVPGWRWPLQTTPRWRWGWRRGRWFGCLWSCQCWTSWGASGGNCLKICLPGKSILIYYFQENRTSRRPFLLLIISFPWRPILIQLIPGWSWAGASSRGRCRRPPRGSTQCSSTWRLSEGWWMGSRAPSGRRPKWCCPVVRIFFCINYIFLIKEH